MQNYNHILKIMVLIRLLSGLTELTAAAIMKHYQNIEIALRINAILGIIGPVILIIVTFLGLVGISDELSLKQVLLIALGIILIFLGTRQ
ncbi:MAG: DUF2619 domain-containing protein [Halanaerobiales bacterium]